MPKRFLKRTAAFGISQYACAVARIKPSIHSRGEKPVEFLMCIVRPRMRMVCNPCIPFALPLGTNRGGQGIGEAECHKIRCAGLFPVGKPSACHSNSGEGIEELKILNSHEDLRIMQVFESARIFVEQVCRAPRGVKTTGPGAALLLGLRRVKGGGESCFH
jgi:hypothetical protein